MRCVLVHPPLCDPSCPPLGLSYLSSALVRENIDHSIFDLNLDFIRYISGDVSPDTTLIYNSSSDYIIAAGTLRNNFDSRNTPDQSLSFAPYSITLPRAAGNLLAIRTAACESDGHLQRWLRQSSAVRRLAAIRPDWVGVSLSFMGQLPAAFAIANYCRRHLQTSVIFGGGLCNDFAEHFNPDAPPWTDITGVIIGAGEDIVTQMIRLPDGRIAPATHRTDFSNKRWLARKTDLTTPPVPDFSHFPLDDYLAPGRVLPFRAFSACSWDKCAFCADAKYHYHTAAAAGNTRLITEQVIQIVQKYDAAGIYFLDAELSTSFLEEFARILKGKQPFPLRWGGNARFSVSLAEPITAKDLFAAGCQLLRFGLESASPAVLKKMNKGISPRLASRVLASMHREGIATHIYLMKGFPGETEDDWQATLAFLYDNAEHIDMFNISSFQLYPASPLIRSIDAEVHDLADDSHWVKPTINKSACDLEADELLFHQIENDFFTRKPYTRCFFNTADTLLLSEKFNLTFT